MRSQVSLKSVTHATVFEHLSVHARRHVPRTGRRIPAGAPAEHAERSVKEARAGRRRGLRGCRCRPLLLAPARLPGAAQRMQLPGDCLVLLTLILLLLFVVCCQRTHCLPGRICAPSMGFACQFRLHGQGSAVHPHMQAHLEVASGGMQEVPVAHRLRSAGRQRPQTPWRCAPGYAAGWRWCLCPPCPGEARSAAHGPCWGSPLAPRQESGWALRWGRTARSCLSMILQRL
jgi:hypothetical protein